MGYANELKSSLVNLAESDLDNIFESQLDSLINSTHPCLLHRFEAIEFAQFSDQK